MGADILETALPEDCFATDALLALHSRKDVLRFITCGSVDDGKSTLIGRLLHDSKQLLEDQLAALRRDSRRFGGGDGIDFALAVDGLAAEREQGITIDVAYRYFSTAKRSFIVADTPGHEQYTRNMATGASTADLAVLLIDARKGLTRQTRRHSLLVSMIGIRRVVLAINKMDLVGWSEGTYRDLMADYLAFARSLGFADVTGIPLSALNGDNIVDPGVAAPWYAGPTLLQHLETVPVGIETTDAPFRMPVQWVNRPDATFRGFAGRIAGGVIRIGDRIRACPDGLETTVTRIVGFDGDLGEASWGQSVTLVVADEIDISRGDVLAAIDAPPRAGDRLDVRVFYVGSQPLTPGTTLRVKIGTAAAQAMVESVSGRVDPDTTTMQPAPTLAANEIGDVALAIDRRVAFDAYANNHDTGSLILIDPVTCDTVAIGLVRSFS